VLPDFCLLSNGEIAARVIEASWAGLRSMFTGVTSTALSYFPGDAVLIALLLVPPAVIVGYARYHLLAVRSRPEFSLRKLESLELERASILLHKAVYRIAEIADSQDGGSYRSKRQRRKALRRKFRHELDELEAYIRDLRSTITTIRSRPLQRYKYWIHIHSAQYLCGWSTAFYSVGLLLAMFACFSAQPSLPPNSNLLLWDIPAWPLHANWLAVTFTAMVAPLFYIARRNRLQREQLYLFEELTRFAHADPTTRAENSDEPDEPNCNFAENERWFVVLEVSPLASLDEVKRAYKKLIKASHPDRVHDMSPAFRALAEVETKKLNAAYEEALLALRDESHLYTSLQQA